MGPAGLGVVHDRAARQDETSGRVSHTGCVGRRRLGAKKLDSFLRRYDTIVEQGLAANPLRSGRKRDYVEKESYNLVCALRDLKKEVTLFATDISVPFTNNQAESDLRMAKLQQKISGSFRAAEGSAVTVSLGCAPIFRRLTSYGLCREARRLDRTVCRASLDASNTATQLRASQPLPVRVSCASLHISAQSWYSWGREWLQ